MYKMSLGENIYSWVFFAFSVFLFLLLLFILGFVFVFSKRLSLNPTCVKFYAIETETVTILSGYHYVTSFILGYFVGMGRVLSPVLN